MHLPRRLALASGIMFAAGAAFAQDHQEAQAQAKLAATQWLALADAGQFGDTWDQAAAPIQALISKPKWVSVLQAVRTPLGSVQTRQLKSADFTKTLPGAPDGAYVVIRFETQFANKASAVETLTPMKGEDGAWRVSGYFIK
ncbi:DUF4019 domain-containing protein [Paucibacter sp. TC2R-5]|uniref:DUF4019 domain-containing protein n=1 Tax=Paucibacter sp. TC2R-5 TaxID=2893555 RepID=UPI0021E3FC1D|nr:DUF4019 domain-containing protein [Paucibacter sp. TC2R-5]MCV2360332.1 DUF4019 domain-containing protein [Paucibacter sp. TC2R-5]